MNKRVKSILNMKHKRKGSAIICMLLISVIMSGTVLALGGTSDAADDTVTEAVSQVSQETAPAEESTIPEEIIAPEENSVPEASSETEPQTTLPEENEADVSKFYDMLSSTSAYMFFGEFGEWQKTCQDIVVIDGREMKVCDLDALTDDNKFLYNGHWVDMDEFYNNMPKSDPIPGDVTLLNYDEYGLYYDSELKEYCYEGKVVFIACMFWNNDEMCSMDFCDFHMRNIETGIILKVTWNSEGPVITAVEDGKEFSDLIKYLLKDELENVEATHPRCFDQWILKKLDERAANG